MKKVKKEPIRHEGLGAISSSLRQSEEELTERIGDKLQSIPLFPLPEATLLPGETLPFHIFEPRYRAMIEDVLLDQGLIALPWLHQDEEERGLPAIEPICGVGELVSAERLEDGRFDIALRGVARMRIVEELPQTRPYRLVRGQLLGNIWPLGGPPVLADEGESLRMLLYKLCTAFPSPASNVLAGLATRLNCPSALSDLGCIVALTTPEQRQKVLQTQEVKERLLMAKSAMQRSLAKARSPGRWQLN